jgi:hypothetical protein
MWVFIPHPSRILNESDAFHGSRLPALALSE